MINILKCNLTRFLITSWNHNIYGISLCALLGPRPWPLQTFQHSLLYLRLNSDRYQVSHSDQESSDLNNLLSADSVDPPVWSLQPSYTMPLLSSGHKTGLTSFYAGTLPRARLEHMAATCSRSVAGGRNCFWHWGDKELKCQHRQWQLCVELLCQYVTLPHLIELDIGERETCSL